MLLLNEVETVRQVARGENGLADVLGVVLDTLVEIFTVDQRLALVSWLDNITIIVTEDWIKQMLLATSLISNELRATE